MRIQTLLDQRKDFARIAKEAGTSEAYLYQLAYGYSRASPDMAKRLELATGGRTTRIEMRPDIYGE